MTETRWDWFPAALRAAGARSDVGEVTSFVEAPLATGGWVPPGTEGAADGGWLADLAEAFAARGPLLDHGVDPTVVLADALAAPTLVDDYLPPVDEPADGESLRDPFDLVPGGPEDISGVGDGDPSDSAGSWEGFEELLPADGPAAPGSSAVVTEDLPEHADPDPVGSAEGLAVPAAVDAFAHDPDPFVASFEAMGEADDVVDTLGVVDTVHVVDTGDGELAADDPPADLDDGPEFVE
jgi:hypothetical protein